MQGSALLACEPDGRCMRDARGDVVQDAAVASPPLFALRGRATGAEQRLEGHARITIQLDERGDVRDARFHVTEFRGFETFCEGRHFQEMPALTSRVCGICPVSHMIASADAGDQVLAVRVPENGMRLRRIVNLAQIIQSHAQIGRAHV
mgnify:CR=1 FL=1